MTVDPVWRGFMLAYATYVGSRNWHADLATFHQRRYEVYCELLEVVPHDGSNRTGDHRYVDDVLGEFASAYHKLNSPFAAYLEAPGVIRDIYHDHGWAMDNAFTRLREAYIDVMVDCATRLWGPCPRLVTDEQLNTLGVGPAQEPDFVDYF